MAVHTHTVHARVELIAVVGEELELDVTVCFVHLKQ